MFGGLGGIILGALINIPLVQRGIDYSSIMETGDLGYRVAGIVYGAWYPKTYLTAFAIGLLMALFIAWFPTRRALKLEIPVCLRFI